MFVKKIELKNYRNHKKLLIEEISKTNLVLGSNAAGKTNLMEAITRLNGFNKNKENSIFFGEEKALISIEIVNNSVSAQHTIQINKTGDKNNIEKNQPLGKAAVIQMGPEDGNFFNGGPQERRNYLDQGCSFLKKRYHRELIDYQRIVKQKNNLLKEFNLNDTLINSFNEALVEKAFILISHRLQFINDIFMFTQDAHNKLSGKNKKIDLLYVSETDTSKIKESLEGQLEQNKELEKTRGRCLVGPHRDDLVFNLEQKSISEVGSQGEKKTACISLKVAQIKSLTGAGIKPILIIDDALSELDMDRRQHLLTTIDECEQAFITATEDNGLILGKNINKIMLINK